MRLGESLLDGRQLTLPVVPDIEFALRHSEEASVHSLIGF
jgi:hypothetical protein